MNPEPQREHRWLDKLVGAWTCESECIVGPDQPPMKSVGSEVVRSIGGLWIVAEGQAEMPEGGVAKTMMTIGYSPLSHRFEGTFVASMMTHLWVYHGSLDAAEKVLTLDTEGPDFTGQKLAKYKDVIELIDDDHRLLTSQMLGEDGQWRQFMTARYSRKK